MFNSSTHVTDILKTIGILMCYRKIFSPGFLSQWDAVLRLLKLGRKNLRCCDWAAQAAELWRPDGPVGPEGVQLSRPVLRGETIDYFVPWGTKGVCIFFAYFSG